MYNRSPFNSSTLLSASQVQGKPNNMNTEKALSKIRKFFRNSRRLPTYQEIADMMGFASKNAAFKLVGKLIEGGFLEKDDSGHLIPRYLFSPQPATGVVRAGFPTPMFDTQSDLATIDEYLIDRPEATFILKVAGDSMIDAGIFEGDLVLVERGRSPRIGDIIVAAVDGEWTMKYFHKENGQPVLVPANKKYPKIYPESSLTTEGIVISVIRKYN